MFRVLKPHQLVVDVVVAALFGLLALPLELENGRMTAWNALATALVCVAMAGAMAVRRLSPRLALALAWAGAFLQMGFGRPPSFADVAIFAVLYTTSAYGDRVVFWLGFASSLVGAVVATSYVYFVLNAGGLSLRTITVAVAVLIAATFALLLAWTVGALVRTARRARANRIAQERAEAEASAEQERVGIARDMHDVVAHSLAVVIAQADGARYAAAADPAAQTAALGTISSTARAALADVRVLLTQLRQSSSSSRVSVDAPAASDRARSDPADAPQPAIADLERLYAQLRAAGVDLWITVDPVPAVDPPAAIQLAVYRILQEALTNALRHGDGGPVVLRLAWLPDRVDLEVRNTLAAAVTPGPGHGVIGMRERAQLVGGRLEAAADAGSFAVRATLPIGDAA